VLGQSFTREKIPRFAQDDMLIGGY
jgi:hypothetical protein